MRLVLVAPTVDVNDVGEAWVAYQWAHLLSERFDVTLLTYRKRGAPRIAPQVPQARVIEWVEPPGVGRFERFNSLLKPGYPAFDIRARAWLRAAQAAGQRFDVGHQVVPVAMRYPSPLRGAGIPYVMGPVGGSLSSPPAFADSETGPWYQRLRGLDAWRMRHDPALRATYESAALVLGIADYVREFLADLRLRRFEVMSETGLPVQPPRVVRSAPSAFTPGRPLRLLFVGRLIRTKGVRDLVAAMGLLRGRPVTLDVVGDGFDAAACTALAEDLQVTDAITFHGWLPHEAVLRSYADADVFAFPSYREPGGNVVFEAMGQALPLIVCGRGGPGAAVDDSCAIRIPATSPEQLASAIAGAVSRFLDEPALVARLGNAAPRRLAEVGLWGPKIDRMAELYDEVARDSR